MPGVAVDSHDRLWIFTRAKLPVEIYDGQEKPCELNWVHGIAVDSAGNIYAGDITATRAPKVRRRNHAGRIGTVHLLRGFRRDVFILTFCLCCYAFVTIRVL